MRSAFGLALHGNVGAWKGCRPDTNAGWSSSIALASGVWRASIGNLSPQALQSVPLQRHLGVCVVPHSAQLLSGFFRLAACCLPASVSAVPAAFPTDGAGSLCGALLDLA